MRHSLIPFNLSFLELTPQKLALMKPVTSLNIYDSKHEAFHPDGLWSNTIFGPPGNPMRNLRFSYINVKVDLIHPVYYKALVDSKKFYKGIMEGSEYAIWNPKEKDFERSDNVQGKTGFAYFIQHIKEITLKDTGTVGRKRNIDLLEKYRDKCTTQYVVVLPAGLRDVEIKDGRPTVDDINDYYKQLMMLSNNINEATLQHDISLIDHIRMKMQLCFIELYQYINSIVSGKRGLFLGKWASRKVQNTSRNVITASAPGGAILHHPDNIGYMTAVVGLYQQMKNILPFVVNEFKSGFIASVFQDSYLPVSLVHPKTLKSVELQLDSKYFDLWQTKDGINKLINHFADEEVRHTPILIEGHYLALIYKAEEEGKKVFKLLRSIDELPMDKDKVLVEPITYAELYYITLAKVLNKFPMITVRYPIAGTGSNIPNDVKVQTTMRSDVRYMLDDNWAVNEEERYPSFPIKGERFHNALSPAVSTLSALGADFDGDTMSSLVSYSDESIKEIQDYRKSARGYLDTSGRILHSTNVDTVKYVCVNLSS